MLKNVQILLYFFEKVKYDLKKVNFDRNNGKNMKWG